MNPAPLREYRLLYESFGDQLNNFPTLDIGDRSGSTDYIDFITVDDMKFPIMQGVDKFNQSFLAIKVKCVWNPQNEEKKYPLFLEKKLWL